MIQQSMLEKKILWFGNGHSLNRYPDVQVSGLSQGCQEPPASLSHYLRSLCSTPLADLWGKLVRWDFFAGVLSMNCVLI